MLIADHARAKEAPPNSVTWKYINECVTKGELVNIEDYRIHQASEARPVSSTRPTKGTRVDYSKKDEQILVTWVRQQVKAGKGIKGNEIYKDLATRVSIPRPSSVTELLTPSSIRITLGTPGGLNGFSTCPCFQRASCPPLSRSCPPQPRRRLAYLTLPQQPRMLLRPKG